MKDKITGFAGRNLRLLLLIVPVIYLFLGFYFNKLSGIYFIRSVDSEYIYFISGLSLARGHFLIGHIDNPASPLQYVVALAFKALYIIRKPESGLIDDAILNSELYLKVANLTLITLTSCFLLVSGVFACKLTKSLSLSVLIQSTPFITELSLDNLSRFAPEAFLIMPVILMIYFMVYVMQEENTNPVKMSVWAGLIAGFGLSVKLTFFPLWILPLFILQRKRFLYLTTATGSFFVFALPVTLQIAHFYHWLKRLIFFTGQHGQGEKKFMDWQTFWPNLHEIYNANKFYFKALLVFCLVFAIYIFLKRKDRKIIRIAAGTLLVVLGLLFMVGKHFEYRYFIMALYLFPLMVILAAKMLFPDNLKKISHFAIPVVFLLISGFLIYKQLSVIPIKTMHISEDVNNKTKSWQFASTLPEEAVKIIASSYYGGAYAEYAFMFTGAYAGKWQYDTYQSHFARLFPRSYIYQSWDRSMHHWGKPLEIKGDSVPLYVYLHSTPIGNQLFEDLQKFTTPGTHFEKDTIYHNTYSDETFLKVTPLATTP